MRGIENTPLPPTKYDLLLRASPGHDITELLLKVALNTINQLPLKKMSFRSPSIIASPEYMLYIVTSLYIIAETGVKHNKSNLNQIIIH